MYASELLNRYIIPLQKGTALSEAELQFEDAQVFYLPVLDDNKKILGLISLEQVIQGKQEGKSKISELNDNYIIAPAISENSHYYEILKLFGQSESDTMPVIDSNGEYIGSVSLQVIAEQSSNMLSSNYPGAIIVLEIGTKDYSLSEIVRLIESNDVKVLGLEVVELHDSDKLHLHIKLNTGVLRPVLASLERFGYKIHAHFMRQDISDDIEKRYRQLMQFIDFD